VTYPEAIQFLYDLRWFGTKLGLSNTFKLAALAGNPHHKLRFIHVAGTNGKGSTCAMLESIYRAAGLRVGLFTSPHLVSFGERIQVNRHCISQGDVVGLLVGMQPVLKEFPAEEHPTFFEVVTVMALQYFASQKCDLLIWETGLGGRLDATNIVTPLGSVITSIEYDHQEWLGATLASIAAEKAGIIKPGVPVVTAASQPEALNVIKETARRQHARLVRVTEVETHVPPLDTVVLPLPGQHQRLNAALAVATVRALAGQIPVSDQMIHSGLSEVKWPGRLQLIVRPSGQKILLDGAHNVAGAEAVAAALSEHFASAEYGTSKQKSLGAPSASLPSHASTTTPARMSALPGALSLGILKDKVWPGMCRILAPLARRIFLVPVSSERTTGPEELQRACQEVNPSAETMVCTSVAQALEKTLDQSFVQVTGSLYLVGEALENLEGAPDRALGERSLNEWSVRT
jgi:dihydrofolate synthase / folylpolyglutamate synthase